MIPRDWGWRGVYLIPRLEASEVLGFARSPTGRQCYGRRGASDAKQNTPAFWPGLGRTAWSLEQIPQELVVDLVVELNLLRLDESSQGAGAAVGGGFLQIGVAAFDVLAEDGRDPRRFLEVVQRLVDVVGQIALGLAQVLDLRSGDRGGDRHSRWDSAAGKCHCRGSGCGQRRPSPSC